MRTLTALALLFSLAAVAQQPYIETFEVRLHNLDVVVTDAKGHPMRGLTIDDFVVTEDGAPQRITNFSVYDVSSSTASMKGGASSQPTPPDTPPEIAGSADAPAPPRRFVFFIATAREMEDLVIASLIYPRPVNELGISVTTAAPVRDRGHLRVPLDVVIPLDRLTFLPEGEKYVGVFDIHFAAAGQERDFVSGGKQQQRVELTAEQFEARVGIKYHYKTGIMISPGPARIAIGVLDTTTKLTGFQTVEVAN